MEGTNVNDGTRALIASEIIRKRDNLKVSLKPTGGSFQTACLLCAGNVEVEVVLLVR